MFRCELHNTTQVTKLKQKKGRMKLRGQYLVMLMINLLYKFILKELKYACII